LDGAWLDGALFGLGFVWFRKPDQVLVGQLELLDRDVMTSGIEGWP
jgi:hypothetical protein